MMAALLLCIFVLSCATVAVPVDPSKIVDPAKTQVYGPGILNPYLVYPARYFYIHAVNIQGNKFTESPEMGFNVMIGSADKPCRVWTQALDRHDGSFLVRYKLYGSCLNLRIQIEHSGRQVSHSPYIFPGYVNHEECDCPYEDMRDWIWDMQCPAMHKQIEHDLRPFHTIDMDEVLEEALKRYNRTGSHSICNYVVSNNRIYRRCYGQHVGFSMFIDNILLSLSRKFTLPPLDFIINLGDWPLEKRALNRSPLPIISWCGSFDAFDVVLPTYDITESTLETMGRVMLDMMSVQANTGPKWEDKVSMGFWRGRDSSRERLKLISLAREHPDLINASLTNFFFFRDEEAEYGPRVEPVSFFDFFQYKYQINLDGTVAAYRFPYLLAGDSLVLKQQSQYYEFFYNQLQPMVHYVPIKRDLSDLVEALNWSQTNDSLVRKISRAGSDFAREQLMPRNIFCYHASLFKQYSQRLVSKVQVRPGMERVFHSSTISAECQCQPMAKRERREEL